MSKLVLTFFPGVAKRYQECADWHHEKYGMRPLFGLYWCLCINAMFAGQKRIHCKPHVDSKNVVGVCALVVYEIPGERFCCSADHLPFLMLFVGKKFNHSVRTWLVLWEARVVIQLPPWVVLLYPSSLIYHFNIDVGGV